MPTPDDRGSLEAQIDRWRSYLGRRQAIHSVDVAELEDHLREEIGALTGAGLASDEAFLIAVKRMGDLDALSREFAREHSERLWKQLVVSASEAEGGRASGRTDAIVAFSVAAAAALAVKAPPLFGFTLDGDPGFYARNLSLFVLPLLTGYFAWKRRLTAATVRWLGAGFVAAAIFANAYPFETGGYTEVLAALHLPMALWLVVGVAYKKDVSDVRESPALDVITLLSDRGAHIDYHDPHVPKFPRMRKHSMNMQSVELSPATLRDTDCVVIVTDHDAIDWNMLASEAPLIVDTRNALSRVPHAKARVVKA